MSLLLLSNKTFYRDWNPFENKRYYGSWDKLAPEARLHLQYLKGYDTRICSEEIALAYFFDKVSAIFTLKE
jgi:hypothetical protein